MKKTLAVLFALCFFAVLIVMPAVAQDTTPPQVDSSNVDIGALPANSDIRIEFTEPVTPNGDWFTITCAPGNVTVNSTNAAVSPRNNTLIITPNASLPQTETCQLTVRAAQIADGAQNTLSGGDYVVSFVVIAPNEPGFSYAPDRNRLFVYESGETSETITFILNTRPTAPVTMDVAVSSNQCTLAGSPVVLTPENYDLGVSITITAIDDGISDGTQPCNVWTLDPRSADPVYDAFTAVDTRNILLDVVEARARLSLPIERRPYIISEEGAISPAFTITGTIPPTAPVTIPLRTSSDQCTLSADEAVITAENFESGFTFNVTAVDDDVLDGTQPCNLWTLDPTSNDRNYDLLSARSVPNVQIDVLDNEFVEEPGFILLPSTPVVLTEEGGQSQEFTLRLTERTGNDVTVRLGTSTTDCYVSMNSVTVRPEDFDTGVTFTVTALDDGEAEPEEEICTLLTTRPSSADVAYDALTDEDIPDVPITIIDNDDVDMIGFEILPAGPVTVREGETQEFTIRPLAQPAGSLVMRLVTTAENGDQCTPRGPGFLRFERDITPIAFSIEGDEDSVVDGDQTCDIRLLINTGDPLYAALNNTTFPVIIKDNGADGPIAIEASPFGSQNFPIRIREAGQVTFTLTAGATPQAPITIGLATSNDLCTVSTDTAVLDANNFQTGFTFTVNAIDDDSRRNSGSCNLWLLDPQSDDPLYDALEASDLRNPNIQIVDDDNAQPDVTLKRFTFVPDDGTLESDTLPVRYRLTLDAKPTAPVTMSLSPGIDNACVLSQDNFVFNDTNYAIGAEFTLTVVDNNVRDGNRNCVLVFTSLNSDDSRYTGLQLDFYDTTFFTVIDDESPEADIIISPDPTQRIFLNEGEAQTYRVRLTTKPAGPITLPLVIEPNCILSPTDVILNRTNWNSGVTFTVVAFVDEEVRQEQICNVVTNTLRGRDDVYSAVRGQMIPNVLITRNADPEFVEGQLTLSPTQPLTLSEAGAQSQTFT
ncbi:MAG: Ig-like domain-containing protein, partial [Chloroflexota bacterium]